MARRGYPPEFRRRVVDLVEGGRKVAEVAAELGISEQTIYTWRRQARVDAGTEAGVACRVLGVSVSAYYEWRNRSCRSSKPRPSRDVRSDDREDDQADRDPTVMCVADSSTCASRARQPLWPHAVIAAEHGLPSSKLIMRPSGARPTLQ
jgi:transposase-like protein